MEKKEIFLIFGDEKYKIGEKYWFCNNQDKNNKAEKLTLLGYNHEKAEFIAHLKRGYLEETYKFIYTEDPRSDITKFRLEIENLKHQDDFNYQKEIENLIKKYGIMR